LKKWNSKVITVGRYNLGLIKHVIYVDIDISNYDSHAVGNVGSFDQIL